MIESKKYKSENELIFESVYMLRSYYGPTFLNIVTKIRNAQGAHGETTPLIKAYRSQQLELLRNRPTPWKTPLSPTITECTKWPNSTESNLN